jgi:indolepyruvate ferredoxin oxidoreductase alpha subunit
MGIETTILDPFADPAGFERLLVEKLATPRLSVIVARRPCVLAAADIRGWEKAAEASRAALSCSGCAVEDA